MRRENNRCERTRSSTAGIVRLFPDWLRWEGGGGGEGDNVIPHPGGDRPIATAQYIMEIRSFSGVVKANGVNQNGREGS